MIRVLILGGGGMLGHKMWQICSTRFDTWVTLRSRNQAYLGCDLFDPERLIPGVEALDSDSVLRAFRKVSPNVVVNCIGLIKQLPEVQDPIMALSLNSLFPHRVAKLCGTFGARMIQISTDCVFSGRKGRYKETDVADAEDLYGRSKLMGEVFGPNVLTLRTSIIGRELRGFRGLVEWFLKNGEERVDGYTRAVFSGLTTLVFCRAVADVVQNHGDLNGLYHVSSEPISKYDLLILLKKAYQLSGEVERCADMAVDRSLDGRLFRERTGFVAPSWEDMIWEFAHDPMSYDFGGRKG